MIIYCDSSGFVSSIPSTVPVGTILKDVTIIAPTNTAVAMLKIKPPNGELLKPIYCSMELTTERDIIYKANLPKAVTSRAGRADYQIVFTNQDGSALPTRNGTFSVARGVEVDLPENGEDLGAHSLEDIHRLLTNATALYANVNNLYSDVETVKRVLGVIYNVLGLDENLELPETFLNIIDALQKIDTVLEHNPFLNTDEKSLTGAINELHSVVGDLKDEHTAILTKHKTDIEKTQANIQRLFNILGEQPLPMNE